MSLLELLIEVAYKNWWGRLRNHKKFKVNSYLLLTQEQYPEVIKWLSQQRGINKPKLRRTDNYEWRKSCYASIYRKMRDIGKDKAWVYSIAQKECGRKITSLTELREQELDHLCTTILSKKK